MEVSNAESESRGHRTGFTSIANLSRTNKVLERDPSTDELPFCGECLAHSLVAGREVERPFQGCALVGSSSNLLRERLGKHIDSFPTVIRVNRLPTPEFFGDYGARTDVLFTGAVVHGQATFTQRGQTYQLFGGKTGICLYNQTGCPFHTVVLKGADEAECGLEFSKRYPVGKPGWVPSRSLFRILQQSEEINGLAYRLLGWEGQPGELHTPRPTNGFQAFLWAVAACDDLYLFGFGGEDTADHHGVNKNVHSLDAEHELIEDFYDGRLDRGIEDVVPSCAPCISYKRLIGRFPS